MSPMHGMTITPDLHDQWLRERQKRLGASEAAVAIGLPGYSSRLQLYLRKTGQLPDAYESADIAGKARMSWGLRHEPAIAQAYLDECGGAFVASQMFCVSKSHDFMCATLDRVHDSGKVVEIKTTGEGNARDWGEPGTDEIPHVYLVQVLHQLHCACLDTADVAVLIGGADFRVYTVDRQSNTKTLERIIALEEEFMRAVRTGTPPKLDPEKDAGILAYLWPEELEYPPVQFSDRENLAWAAYEDIGRQIKNLESEREAAKIVVATAMENYAHATLVDGRLLTRKIIEVEEACVMRKAFKYPRFYASKPKGRS